MNVRDRMIGILQEPEVIEEIVRACVEDTRSSAVFEFVKEFQRLIASTAIKTARRFGNVSPDLVDDLIQETYVRLFQDDRRVLRQYRAEKPGAIYGFVQSVAFST